MMSIHSATMCAALAALACGLTGCISSQARDGDWQRVVETTWTLTRMDNRSPLKDNANPVGPLTLELSGDGRAAGFAGVNRFFGRYESSPQGDLRFAALGSTRMFRDDPPGLMDQEHQLLSILSDIDAFRIQRGKLVLLSDKQKRLVYAPAAMDADDQGTDQGAAATPE